MNNSFRRPGPDHFEPVRSPAFAGRSLCSLGTGAHVGRARELAQLVARQAHLGVQATLASARAGLGHGPDAARDCISSLLPGLLASEDAAEGLRSFAERRDARFTGR